MKRLTKFFCLALCLTAFVCLFVACNEEEHTHEFEEWVTVNEPTCSEEGQKHRRCMGCQETETEKIPALGHAEVSHEAKAPTCAEIGWDAYVTCSRCEYTTYAEKAMVSHTEVSHEAQAPTCTEIGWDAYVTCENCNYTTYAEKPALNHDEITHEAKAPSCTEIGWDAYVTCSRCDYSTYAEKAIVDHTFVDRICSECSAIDYSKGLEFTIYDNYAWLMGMGDCTDTVLYVPPTTPDGFSVTHVNEQAFYENANITHVILPDSVTDIDAWAFYGCTNLANITLGDNITYIGVNAFYNTAYYNDENNWENDVLYNGIYLLNAKTTLWGDYTIKDGTKTVAHNAFERCGGLISITVPDSVETMVSVFSQCNGLNTAILGNGLTYVSWLFEYCTNLRSVTLGNNVTEIGYYAFKSCVSLQSLVLPATVTEIHETAFDGCVNLTDIYFMGTEEQWNAIEKTEYAIPTTATVHFNYVPSAS